MTTPDAESKRSGASFDTVAADYDRYRRGYPPEVIDCIRDEARIGPGSRVLEIGCGTGQMTRPLLQAGALVTAVEVGPALARIARANLADFPTVGIEVAAFEHWPLPDERFDAVVSATAFHWVDRATRAEKAAEALRTAGCLALVYPHHIDNHTTFIEASQPYYLKWGLSVDPGWRPPQADDVPLAYPEVDACPAFQTVTRHRIQETQVFTTETYVGLLRTDSLILTLAPSAREGFLADMADLIDTWYGGRVMRTYLYEIVLARKPS